MVRFVLVFFLIITGMEELLFLNYDLKFLLFFHTNKGLLRVIKPLFHLHVYSEFY